MEQTWNSQVVASPKIYKNRAIEVGTVLGGPLVAGYFIAENYKAFNERDKVKKAWMYSILSCIIIFGGLFLIPDSIKIPNHFIPLLNGGIAYFVVKHFQGEKINTHLNSGGLTYSWGRAIGISLIIAIITLLVIFAIAFLSGDFASDNMTQKSYGFQKHEISYDKTNITLVEVDKIAEALTKSTFFDESQQKFVYVEKINNDYEISIPIVKEAKNDSGTITFFRLLKNDMQTFFPNNKIIINLVVDRLDNVAQRLE